MKLRAEHPAVTEGRPVHPNIRDPFDNKTPILKSVVDNTKLGNGSNIIIKGKWKGMPLLSLTLPERTTCPSDCMRWRECFGNSMPFAHRFAPGMYLEHRIRDELAPLSLRYREGFVIRLHILGDFYSLEYVEKWLHWLDIFPMLRVYGYSARFNEPIARAISAGRVKFPDRWWIRFSRNFAHSGHDIFASQEGKVPGAITCPEQTGKVESCLHCGLCWEIERTIEFIDHDKLKMIRRKAREAQA